MAKVEIGCSEYPETLWSKEYQETKRNWWDDYPEDKWIVAQEGEHFLRKKFDAGLITQHQFLITLQDLHKKLHFYWSEKNEIEKLSKPCKISALVTYKKNIEVRGCPCYHSNIDPDIGLPLNPKYKYIKHNDYSYTCLLTEIQWQEWIKETAKNMATPIRN